MGYKKPQKLFVLEFADEEFKGLEVRATSLPIGRFLDLMGLADKGSGDADQANALLDGFASALKSWNLEDENDQPVPATREGLVSLDIEFVMAIIKAWMTSISGVSVPLDGGSNSGSPALEHTIPMES